MKLILLATFLFLQSSFARAQQVARPAQLDIILLIDCSRSTRTTDPDSLRLLAARFLLAYLDTNFTVRGVTYRVSVANFGDKVGKTMPLGERRGTAVRDSLDIEQFNYTDFGPPLQFALDEFKNKNSFDQGNRRAVVLFTDGKPRLPSAEFFGDEKQHYFMGGPIAGGPANYPLSQIVHELQDSSVKLYMLAIGADRQDAELWQKLIPFYHHHPIDKTTNLNELYKNLFADLFDLGLTLKKSDAASSIETAAISEKLQQTRWWLWFVAILFVTAAVAFATYWKKDQNAEKKRRKSEEDYKGLEGKYTELQKSLKSEREEWRNKAPVDKLEEAIKSFEKKMNDLIEDAEREEQSDKKDEKLGYARDFALDFLAKLPKGENAAAEKFKQILLLRLEIYKIELNMQRQLIRDEVGKNANSAQIRGLAGVLHYRWTLEPKLMIEEFYDVLCQPKGFAVMEVLSSIKPEEEWDKYQKRRAENVQLMADAYCRFDQTGSLVA